MTILRGTAAQWPTLLAQVREILGLDSDESLFTLLDLIEQELAPTLTATRTPESETTDAGLVNGRLVNGERCAGRETVRTHQRGDPTVEGRGGRIRSSPRCRRTENQIEAVAFKYPD